MMKYGLDGLISKLMKKDLFKKVKLMIVAQSKRHVLNLKVKTFSEIRQSQIFFGIFQAEMYAIDSCLRDGIHNQKHPRLLKQIKALNSCQIKSKHIW